MDKNKIAQRYAAAIYDVAKSDNNLEEVREVLHLLSTKFKEDKDFRIFLTNPIITSDEKDTFLKKSFSFLSKEAFNIVLYTVNKDRAEYLPLIDEKFLEIYYKEEGSLPVIGIFTKELNESQIKKLQEKLEKRYNKKVVLSLEIDESIIGGGIIKVGSDVINGSLKHQIEDMKRMF